MENHGPLHLETITAAESERLLTAPLPKNAGELAIYLRHIANADKMTKILRRALAARAKPAYFCSYGDHVPIMPSVYAATSTPDGRTNYFIWRNQSAASIAGDAPICEQAKDEKISNLGLVLLRHAGHICGRRLLLEEVWEYHFDQGSNLVDVFIRRLRQKLDVGHEVKLLHTVRRAGYVLREGGL